MPRRLRKFIGAIVMIAFVVIYGLGAMLVAQTDHIRYANAVLQAIFFCVVGLAWVLPLMPLIKWMERPDPDDPAYS